MYLSRGKRLVQLCDQSREVNGPRDLPVIPENQTSVAANSIVGHINNYFNLDSFESNHHPSSGGCSRVSSVENSRENQPIQYSPEPESEASVDDSIADPDFNENDYLDLPMDNWADISDEEIGNPDEDIGNPDETINVEAIASPKQTTMQVEISKKKRKLTKEEKINRDKTKHPMKEDCGFKCKRDCKKFTDDDRRDIWNNYWSLEYISRRKWLAKCVQLVSIQRRVKPQRDKFLKNESRKFFLQKDNKSIQVCRKFFLNTLGYTNDSVITELICALKRKSLCSAVTENRGGVRKNIINFDCIRQHINSYHPSIRHYRRYNAPNVKYLPRELNVATMLADFKSKYPGEICGRETYRKTLKEMNVSFNMPKSDTCLECLTYKQLKEDGGNADEEDFLLHKEKARKATEEYGRDRERPDCPTLKVYSMDLQKVILIPNMPGVKPCYFTSRLVVFNETFAGLKKHSTYTNYCSMWHEAIANRSAQSIVDSILNVIQAERDVKNFILWADNCSAQNKNWFLFTALVVIVNDVSGGPLRVNIKYLTKGHTHMTADSIHGNIEKYISRVGNVYDYDDLKNNIKKCRKNLEVLDVQVFRKWEKKKRTTKKKDDPLTGFLLSEVVEVLFERSSRKMKFKTDFNQEEYKEVDFLQKRFDITKKPEAIITPRGIQTEKKDTILTNLVTVMPINRQQFWKDLPESDVACDLVHEFGDNNEEMNETM